MALWLNFSIKSAFSPHRSHIKTANTFTHYLMSKQRAFIYSVLKLYCWLYITNKSLGSTRCFNVFEEVSF